MHLHCVCRTQKHILTGWNRSRRGARRASSTMSDRQSFEPRPAFHAVAIGETLAAFMRGDAPDRYSVTAIGAESNVAVGMAQLGCRTQWVSRLGEDRLGHFIHDSI